MWRTSLAGLLAATLVTVAPAADRHLGVATCASTTCHGRAKPAEGPIPQTEYLVWSRYDPHAGAYAVLREERSQVMARRLGLPAAHEARECLACHTDDVPATERGPRFQPDDGIGCEACHGGAERWLASHYAPADDHQARRAANRAAGLVPLDEPATRAGVCLRCHVGDTGDRFASHRMMAAGHPRLAFELDTWTELWRTAGGREHYVRDADYAARKPVPDSIAVWTTGLVHQARQQATLIAGRYRDAAGLPDFALFNCYSCHREMRLAEWRDRSPAVSGDPGQLRFDDSTLRLLATALAARPALQSGLRRAADGLQRSAGQPAATVRGAGARLDGELNGIAAALAGRPLTGPEARTALGALVAAARRGDYPDYASAEQAVIALVVLGGQTPGCDVGSPVVQEVLQALATEREGSRAARILARAPCP